MELNALKFMHGGPFRWDGQSKRLDGRATLAAGSRIVEVEASYRSVRATVLDAAGTEILHLDCDQSGDFCAQSAQLELVALDALAAADQLETT